MACSTFIIIIIIINNIRGWYNISTAGQRTNLAQSHPATQLRTECVHDFTNTVDPNLSVFRFHARTIFLDIVDSCGLVR
jgi:hypothetical protein